MKNEISGFSVIELVIALAVGAIVVTMAAPSMTSMVKNSRLTGTANTMSTALNYARIEAGRRQQHVVVAPSPGAAGWNGGWTVSLTADPLNPLRVFPAPPTNVIVASDIPSYEFIPAGFITNNVGGTITICDDRKVGRLFFVAGSGRIALDPTYVCP